MTHNQFESRLSVYRPPQQRRRSAATAAVMRNHSHHRGAASLVVVMVLFFLMMLVTAYANRALVFEQRTSANQYRSTQAFEAAEAGLQWALAMLNGGRVGANCTPSVAPADNSFRERYTQGNLATGMLTPVANTSPLTVVTVTDLTVRPGCVRTAAGWSCTCPSAGQPALLPPAGAGAFPAFTVEFRPGITPGTLGVVSRGCSGVGRRCVHGSAFDSDAYAALSMQVALASALGTPPSAALTARGLVDVGAASVGFHNPDSSSNGITVNAGGSISAASARVTSVPGSPAAGSLLPNDASLSVLTTDEMFKTYFGMDKATFQRRPSVARVTCGGDCTAAVQAAVDNKARMIWVEGAMTLASGTVVGSAAEPVVLVVNGNASFGGTTQVHGLVYAAADWDLGDGGTALVRGAAIAEGAFRASGTPNIYYDSAVLTRLNMLSGSFTRVSGSWKDFGE